MHNWVVSRPVRITREVLTPLIRARGPVSATELAALLRVNRTTIARALADFGADLVTLGATRSTRYLMRRNIRAAGSRWPVYRIDEQGRAAEWAELEALHEQQWRVSWAGEPPSWAAHFTESNGLWQGLPFFLDDVRPQGFLGRAIAGRLARVLQVPDDPRLWSDEDVIVYLQAAGEDLPGNLVVGDDCLRRALASAADLTGGTSIEESSREHVYPAIASQVADSLPGSSAGGEQPKFLATLRDGDARQPVLVKFSAPMDQAVGRRWADLLLCEFHAHRALADAGWSLPGARLLDAGGRRFLELPRFDRSGAGGRSGVVSLGALTTALDGTLTRNWLDSTPVLEAIGLMDASAHDQIRSLRCFGELIGNTDMHAGNLAFFLSDAMPLRVTPAYDMLPMLWAPGPQGEIIERAYAPAPPIPSMTQAWCRAAEVARRFWESLIGDPRLSPSLAEGVQQAHVVFLRLCGRVGV